MALVHTVNDPIVVSSDCSTITITDGTGTYDAGTNVGGYGTPSPARGARGVLSKIVSFNLDSAVKDTTILIGFAPLADTSWEQANLVDGLYNIYTLSAPLWDIAAANLIGDIVYYENGALTGFYTCLIATTTIAPDDNDVNWVATPSTVFEASTIEANNTMIVSSAFVFFLQCAADACYSKATLGLTANIMNGSCNNGNTSADTKEWMKLRAMHNGMTLAITATEYLDAQELAEYLAAYCLELNCDCGC